MIKLIRILLALIGLVLIVMLAVDNRQMVDIIFWPLPFTYQMPLYGVFLLGLIAGALLGGIALWLSSHADRQEARSLRRRMKAVDYQEKLRKEREEAQIVEEARRKTKGLALAAPRA